MSLQCVLYMNVITFTKHRPYRHPIELLSSQISQPILHTLHKAEGHSLLTTDDPQASPTWCTALSTVSCWPRNGAEILGNLENLSPSAGPDHTHSGGGWGPAGLDHILYIICHIMLYYYVISLLYHIILYLKQTATFDLPNYPKTNASTHLLRMHPCNTIDNDPQFVHWF